MIGMNNVGNRTDGEIYLDSASDVADLPQFATDHKLTQGTVAIVIDTGQALMLKSDGTWKEM